MKRRLPFILALTVVLAALGIACKKAGDSPVLRVAHIYEPLAGPAHQASYEWIQDVVTQFKASHTTLAVQLEQIQWDKIDTKSMNDFRAGISHDVLMSSPQLMPQHFEVGDLLDLGPFLSSWSKETIDDFAWTPSWRKCRRGTVQIAIPNGVHGRVVIYRKDYFRQAGLDPEKPPTDLDSLIEAARTLTRDTNGDNRTDIWGLGLYVGASRATIELYFAPLLWHFGGELYDPETKKAVFAGEAGAQAVRWLKDCIMVHKVTPPWAAGEKYDDIIFERFMRGDLAMAWGWGSYWNEMLEKKGWTQGLFPPSPEGRSDKVGIFVTPTRTGAQFANSWALSIHKLSKHPKQAFELIETMLEPNNVDAYADGLPVRRSTWEKPAYQTSWYQTWRRAIEVGRPMPDTPHYNDLADTVYAAVQEIILNDVDALEVLERYQDEFNNRYAKP